MTKTSFPHVLRCCRPLLAIVTVALAVNAWAVKAPEPKKQTPLPKTLASTKKVPLPKTEAACVARGGEWIFAGPQNLFKYCAMATTDGGKACKNASQCQSECVEKPSGSVCAESFDGCFAPTGRGTVTQCVY